MKKLILSLGVGMILSTIAKAEVKMDPIFENDMVLQRELPLPIWGTADPGEKISVSFAGQNVVGKADGKGNWMVNLAPLKTSKEGKAMTVKGSNTITFKNIIVGEVWLASGQSNMAGRFVKAKGRVMDPDVFKNDMSNFRFSTTRGWCTLSEKTQSQISCVAFFFGYDLYKELDVPIGLIQRYNSGTPIQAWMPKDKSEIIRKELGIPEGWNDVAKIRNPGVQFEDKIKSIIPVSFRGVIWYQGERNAKAMTGWEYDKLLAFHIKTWRELWAEKAGMKLRKFPFYYVQVPTQESPSDAEWPWLRNAMRKALDITENTGMAVFYDYGPSLHPNNKEPAGKRLALWALAKDYPSTKLKSGGLAKKLVYSGPLLDKVTIEGSKAVLTFKHVGGGLKCKTGGNKLKFFEIAAKDGKYVPADAEIIGDTVVVKNQKVSAPAYVRYLFRKPKPNPELSLINAEGLPASSFITDNFKPKRP